MANTIVRPTGLAGTWGGGTVSDINTTTANDSTYIFTNDGTSAVGSITFAAITDMAATGTCTLRIRWVEADGGVAGASGGNTVAVLNIDVEGTTVTTGSFTIPENNFATQNVTFDAGDVTEAGTFQVDLNYDTGGGNPNRRRGLAVSWVEFEYPQTALAYSLTADPGSVTITGSDANFLKNPRVVGDPGSISITGIDATLTVTRSISVTADSGSITVTGSSANVVVGRKVTGDSGSVSITGVDATLTYGSLTNYTLTCDAGSISVTGSDAAFLVSRIIVGNSGAVDVTGIDATLTYTPITGVSFTADPGSIIITGIAATFTRTRAVVAQPGSIVITGRSVTSTTERFAAFNSVETDPNILAVDPNFISTSQFSIYKKIRIL